jgi:hypothetical protein
MATLDSVLTFVESVPSDGSDPSLRDGFVQMFNEEIPFEIRNQQSSEGPQQVGTLEAVRVKMLTLGQGSKLKNIRIELSSDNDLFFNYEVHIEEPRFNKLLEKHKLAVDYPEFPELLVRMLKDCIAQPQSNLAVFVVQIAPVLSCRLDFIQNLEYNFVELLSCIFEKTRDDILQEHIKYRYSAVKVQCSVNCLFPF